MAKTITLKTDFSVITMEQKFEGAKVKITIKNQFSWERRSTLETIWTDKDSANKFYSKRIKDGYVVVK